MIDPAFSTENMRAIFAPSAKLARMLEFEAALARAEASVGVIPESAAQAIANECQVRNYDPDAVAVAARAAGNHAIPLVAELTRRVAPGSRGYVHWGTTSQDAIDTALVLQMRDAFEVIIEQVSRLNDALAAKALHYRDTPMAGRTWMQQALPVTLGLKFSAVLSAMLRHRTRIETAARCAVVMQFGGAAGTLASLGGDALAVERALASELALAPADVPWHTQRDRLVDVAATLGTLVATLGKLARDISLLAQTEVAEAFEPALPGRGGSSTLPHKRNPVGCAIALAAATRAPALVATMMSAAIQEHERGLGDWPAEWDTLPALFELAAGSLAAMIDVVEGIEVDAVRMRANLDLTQGRILAEAVQMALATHVGKDRAHTMLAEIVARSATAGDTLADALKADPHIRQWLDASAVDRLLDPAGYLGLSGTFVDRVLANYHATAP